MLDFAITAWCAWSPDRPRREDWLSWAGCDGTGVEPVPSRPVPVALRRRVAPLGQQALRLAWGLPETAASRLVLASRHGDFTRTLGLLTALAADEPLSPAEFSLSVHHALIGLLSIATENRGGHTAVAAGPDSFAYGLLEAAACLRDQPDQPVTLIYCDQPLPPPFDPFSAGEEPLAVVLTLAAPAAGHATVTMAIEPTGGAPDSPSLAFLRFLLSGAATATCAGSRHSWAWQHA